MLFNLLLSLFIGFEIQKLMQFSLFFRLKCLATDYNSRILKRIKSTAYSEMIKVGLIDAVYIVVCIIGLFTINEYFFFLIFMLSVMQNFIFKVIKNKTIRKISYTLDILLTIALLASSIINSYYYHLDGIKFITHFL